MPKKRANGEGALYKRRDGRWAGSYTAQTATGPKRKYVYGKTKAEAAAKLRAAMADRDAGLVFDAGNLTVGDYLYRWLNDSVRGSVKDSTFARDEIMVRVHIAPVSLWSGRRDVSAPPGRRCGRLPAQVRRYGGLTTLHPGAEGPAGSG